MPEEIIFDKDVEINFSELPFYPEFSYFIFEVLKEGIEKVRFSSPYHHCSNLKLSFCHPDPIKNENLEITFVGFDDNDESEDLLKIEIEQGGRFPEIVVKKMNGQVIVRFANKSFALTFHSDELAFVFVKSLENLLEKIGDWWEEQ